MSIAKQQTRHGGNYDGRKEIMTEEEKILNLRNIGEEDLLIEYEAIIRRNVNTPFNAEILEDLKLVRREVLRRLNIANR